MNWEAGDVIGVRYKGENTGRKVLFHEMIVLQMLPGSPQTYAVVGDDGSQFNEDLSADNGEILEIVDFFWRLRRSARRNRPQESVSFRSFADCRRDC